MNIKVETKFASLLLYNLCYFYDIWLAYKSSQYLQWETLYAPKLIISFETFNTILKVFSFSFFPSVTHVLLRTFKEEYFAYQVLKGVS